MGLLLIFIVYDLVVVKYIFDCVLVMYFGYAVELGIYDEVYYNLLYFYIRVLMSVVFIFDSDLEKNKII